MNGRRKGAAVIWHFCKCPKHGWIRMYVFFLPLACVKATCHREIKHDHLPPSLYSVRWEKKVHPTTTPASVSNHHEKSWYEMSGARHTQQRHRSAFWRGKYAGMFCWHSVSNLKHPVADDGRFYFLKKTPRRPVRCHTERAANHPASTITAGLAGRSMRSKPPVHLALLVPLRKDQRV